MGNKTRQDGRVERGQKIGKAFSARAWNRAQEAADIVLGERSRFGADGPAGSELAPNTVFLRNDTGQDIEWLGVVRTWAISPSGFVANWIGEWGAVINPKTGTLLGTNSLSDAARQFARRPVLTGTSPVAGWPFAVAMEPIAAGAFGRCAVSGVVSFRLKYLSIMHRYADVRNGDTTRLQSAACGPIRLLWVDTTPGGDDSFRWACGAW